MAERFRLREEQERGEMRVKMLELRWKAVCARDERQKLWMRSCVYKLDVIHDESGHKKLDTIRSEDSRSEAYWESDESDES